MGQKFENGLEIIGGPLETGTRNKKYLVRCKNGHTSKKWSTSIRKLKIGCKVCYDESLRRVDEKPAVIRAYGTLVANAKARNIIVEITQDKFFEIASKNCHWCDEPPSIKLPPKEWQRSVLLSGVDRIDNHSGYTVENSVACCYNCNRAKSDLPLDKWYYWIKKIGEKNRNLING